LITASIQRFAGPAAPFASQTSDRRTNHGFNQIASPKAAPVYQLSKIPTQESLPPSFPLRKLRIASNIEILPPEQISIFGNQTEISLSRQIQSCCNAMQSAVGATRKPPKSHPVNCLDR
jgi:hypothetical protein